MFHEIHETNIEARACAPEIGRLLEAWHRHARPLPVLSSFDPKRQPTLAPHLMVLLPEPGGGYRYVHYGSAIAEVAGFDMTGRSTADFHSDVGRFFERCYARAIELGRPIYTVHRAAYAVQVHLWERLIMPVAASRGRIGLVVLNKPREYQQDLLKSVLTMSPAAIMAFRAVRDQATGRITDATIVTVNPATAEILRRPPSTLIGRNLLEVYPGNVESGSWAHYLAVMTDRVTRSFDMDYHHDGLKNWFRITAAPLGDGFVVTFTDISEFKRTEAALLARHEVLADSTSALKLQAIDIAAAYSDAEAARAALTEEIERRTALERELERLALCDQLTGLANRRAALDALELTLVTAETAGRPVSIVMIDVDHFKAINDTHGHAGGDAALVEIARRIGAILRPGVDLAARFGGEELLVVLPDTDADEAFEMAEAIRWTIGAEPVVHDGRAFSVSASLGVATWTRDETVDHLLSRADGALYRAKRGGRDRVEAAERPDPACAACGATACSDATCPAAVAAA